MTERSEFVALVRPLHGRLANYDAARSPTDQPQNDAVDAATACPSTFIDAMMVRETVYVKEQNVPLANELDEDDARSFHWVAYASVPTRSQNDSDELASTRVPIGTIRLVPPPHASHHSTAAAPPPAPGTSGPATANAGASSAEESYVKLGRLAVTRNFRGTGVSTLLVETALAFAREHPREVGSLQLAPALLEAAQHDASATASFHGLVLVHAQVGVQKVWARYGFVRDETMGVWDEEGIEHVGMWLRLHIAPSRG